MIIGILPETIGIYLDFRKLSKLPSKPILRLSRTVLNDILAVLTIPMRLKASRRFWLPSRVKILRLLTSCALSPVSTARRRTNADFLL